MQVTPPGPGPDPIAEEEALLTRQEQEIMRLRLAVPLWLRRNPGLTLTALYLFASVIGMTFHHLLLRRFGLNVLEFSETTDFLMVVVREPLTIALALLGIPFYLVYGTSAMWVGRTVQRRFPRLKRSPEKRRKNLEIMRRWMPWLQTAFIGIYAILFVMIYSMWCARQIKAGDFRPMTVEYKTDSPRADGSFRTDKLALLGTTSRFVFFYDPATKRTDVVPLDAIARLNWDARSRKQRAADAAAKAKEPATPTEPAPAAPATVPATDSPASPDPATEPAAPEKP